jgi:hypothetical protein
MTTKPTLEEKMIYLSKDRAPIAGFNYFRNSAGKTAAIMNIDIIISKELKCTAGLFFLFENDEELKTWNYTWRILASLNYNTPIPLSVFKSYFYGPKNKIFWLDIDPTYKKMDKWFENDKADLMDLQDIGFFFVLRDCYGCIKASLGITPRVYTISIDSLNKFDVWVDTAKMLLTLEGSEFSEKEMEKVKNEEIERLRTTGNMKMGVVDDIIHNEVFQKVISGPKEEVIKDVQETVKKIYGIFYPTQNK